VDKAKTLTRPSDHFAIQSAVGNKEYSDDDHSFSTNYLQAGFKKSVYRVDGKVLHPKHFVSWDNEQAKVFEVPFGSTRLQLWTA
jgi:hypothetical protein